MLQLKTLLKNENREFQVYWQILQNVLTEIIEPAQENLFIPNLPVMSCLNDSYTPGIISFVIYVGREINNVVVKIRAVKKIKRYLWPP